MSDDECDVGRVVAFAPRDVQLPIKYTVRSTLRPYPVKYTTRQRAHDASGIRSHIAPSSLRPKRGWGRHRTAHAHKVVARRRPGRITSY